MSEPMLDILTALAHGVGDMTYGDPDDADAVKAADVVRWAVEEIARLREENRLLIEDRSRFPDKPDGIGRIIAAHNANREAKITDLENRCRDSLSEITRLREERRWVPVGERLPELNEANYFRVNCLVYCKIGRVCEMTYEINTYAKHERNRQPRWKWHGMISMWEVTHWMPLKLGPEGDGNG